MSRRALVMGSAIAGLAGVSKDLEMTQTWLSRHGFDIDIRAGNRACRDGMLDGVHRLIRDSRLGDSVVVYYSGHGGYVYGRPDRTWLPAEAATPSSYQYLVPTDHVAGERFRGIFRAELSLSLRDLAEKTRNITVILDCCHSDDMIREDELYSKSIAEPWSAGLERHLESLRESGYDLRRLSEIRNPFVVLLAACSKDESAYEYRRPRDGHRCGVFTDFLLDAVDRRRDLERATWGELMHEVAEGVERRRRTQRPQVSGPIWRRVFSEGERRPLGALRLTHHEGRWHLLGGATVGVEVGDRYELIGGDSSAEDSTAEDTPRIATVALVTSSRAALEIPSKVRPSLQPGMLARPRAGGPARRSCSVQGAGPLATTLRDQLQAVPGLGVVQESGRQEVDFSFRATPRGVEVLNAEGAHLRAQFEFGAEEEHKTREQRLGAVADLARLLTHASRLRHLATSGTRGPQTPWFSLEWGVVDNGVPKPRPVTGARLSTGDRIYLKVENTRRRGQIYVSALDIGVGWDVTLLTDNQSEGVRLGMGDRQVVGQSELRELRGLPLHWPDNVPATQPLEESLIVIVATEQMPIGAWATTSRRPMWDALHRDVGGEITSTTPIDYEVTHIRFQLQPPRDEEIREEPPA